MESLAPRITITSSHTRKDLRGRPVVTEDFKSGYLNKRRKMYDKHGKVRVALGSTINVGNYESARVEVAIEFPFEVPKDCGMDEAVASAESAADTAREIARAKLLEFTDGFEKSGAVRAHT
jgi:hypothetical protein